MLEAIRNQAGGSPESLVNENAPQPQPMNGESLVWIYTTGLTPKGLTGSTSWTISVLQVVG